MPAPNNLQLDLQQARRSINWSALSPAEQKEIVRQHAHHLRTYAEAKRWVKANPPVRNINGPSALPKRFGQLDSIQPNYLPIS